MNAGQHLVALSGLPSGSAAQHLLAIQAGTGTGPGQIIFSSRFSVITGEDRFTVMRKAKRQAPKAKRQAPKAEPAQRTAPQPEVAKDAFARTHTDCVTVSTQVDAITVIQKTQSIVATSDFGTLTINRKVKKS